VVASVTALPASAALQLYSELRETSFPTLYAIANAYEDFSECLAIYVHTVLMRRPYRVELSGIGAQVLTDDCSSVAARCARKFDFIETFLGLRQPARLIAGSADHRPALDRQVPAAQATAFTTRPTSVATL